jgi:hypothetical protein
MPDPSVVATVNGTIITVAVAVASVYVAGPLQTYKSLVDELLGVADRFRADAEAMSYGWQPSQELEYGINQESGLSPTQLFEKLRERLFSITANIELGEPWSRIPGGEPHLDEKAQIAEDGLFLLDLLIKRRPFYAFSVFKSIPDTRSWAEDVRGLEFEVRRVPERTLRELADAYATVRGTEVAAEMASLYSDKLGGAEHAMIERATAGRKEAYLGALSWYLGEMRRAVAIASDVRRRLAELGIVNSRLPWKESVLAGVGGLGAAFVLGVIVPLAGPKTPTVLWFWLPMMVYVVGFLAILGNVVIRYPGRERRDLTDAEWAWSEFRRIFRDGMKKHAAGR